MVMLFFVLDLRSLSLPLLRRMKQSLLQLANHYAIYSPSSSGWTQPKPLPDRIGLCYVFTNRNSCAAELKVAYSPTGDFNLRDFHHAVNNLPTDAFCPELDNSEALSCSEMKLSSILNDQVLYSWGGHDKDITRKVLVISCYIVQNLDYETKKILMDAAEKCVSVEFVLLEHKSNHLGDIAENITNFVKQIGDLENCSFRSHLSDAHLFSGLVKRWFQELKDDTEGIQSRFIFKTNLIPNMNQISCNLYRSFISITDGFISCQTCRCHGVPLEKSNDNLNKSSPTCPLTGNDLGELGSNENSVKVGENTILFMPSFQCCKKLKQISSPIDFIVVERTNLRSLSEGVIFGASYVISPSTYHDLDDIDKTEQNTQLFQVLCHVLNALDQGLVCSSNCNIESMMETDFRCYYILLPSEKGIMLLRRLVASEEILSIPGANHFICSTMAEEMENSVQASLLKLEANDYNPLQHERGFHQKLNFLVKESLQFGAMPSNKREAATESYLTLQVTEELDQLFDGLDVPMAEERTPQLDEAVGDDKSSACIAEEWEQLVVTELPKIHSPSHISKTNLNHAVLSPLETNKSPLETNKQLDEKTSKILERLEVPRQLKRKTASPISGTGSTCDTCLLTKKPLIPYGPSQGGDQGTRLSQPVKPSFQRLKRKR